MNIDARHSDDRLVGRKRLAIDHSLAFSIERVRAHGVKFVEVHMIDAMSDFFVAGETHANRTMSDFGVGH